MIIKSVFDIDGKNIYANLMPFYQLFRKNAKHGPFKVMKCMKNNILVKLKTLGYMAGPLCDITLKRSYKLMRH